MAAADAAPALDVCISDSIPLLDMVNARQYSKTKPATLFIGPNSPGNITPG